MNMGGKKQMPGKDKLTADRLFIKMGVLLKTSAQMAFANFPESLF